MAQCDCLAKLRKVLLEKDYFNAELTNVQMTMNFATKQISEMPEPIRFKYHPKKADGTISKRWKTSFVSANYCPICGIKINSSKE
jgi:hypothetical protein